MKRSSEPKRSSDKREVLRSCLGCRGIFEKRLLIRLTAQAGSVRLDWEQRAPGRGGYLCRELKCVKEAVRRRSFEKKLQAKLGEEAYLQIAMVLEKQESQRPESDGQTS